MRCTCERSGETTATGACTAAFSAQDGKGGRCSGTTSVTACFHSAARTSEARGRTTADISHARACQTLKAGRSVPRIRPARGGGGGDPQMVAE